LLYSTSIVSLFHLQQVIALQLRKGTFYNCYIVIISSLCLFRLSDFHSLVVLLHCIFKTRFFLLKQSKTPGRVELLDFVLFPFLVHFPPFFKNVYLGNSQWQCSGAAFSQEEQQEPIVVNAIMKTRWSAARLSPENKPLMAVQINRAHQYHTTTHLISANFSFFPDSSYYS